MAECTPTTEEVRKAIKAFTVMPPGEKSISVAEFDRWLNQELAKAWDEGYWQGINGHTGPGNPYKEKEQR